MRKVRYVGFIDRILDLNIDGALIAILYLTVFIIVRYVFGFEDLSELAIWYMLAHFIYFIAFLHLKKATPTMMFYRQNLVNEKTMAKASLFQLTIRYIVSYISIAAFGLGYIWILIDKKKRTWHEIISGTVMIYAWAEAPDDLTFAKKIVAKAHGVPVAALKSKDGPTSPIQKI